MFGDMFRNAANAAKDVMNYSATKKATHEGFAGALGSIMRSDANSSKAWNRQQLNNASDTIQKGNGFNLYDMLRSKFGSEESLRAKSRQLGASLEEDRAFAESLAAKNQELLNRSKF